MIEANNTLRFQDLPIETPEQFFKRNPAWKAQFLRARLLNNSTFENPENFNNFQLAIMKYEEKHPGESPANAVLKILNRMNFPQEAQSGIINRIVKIFSLFLLNVVTLGLYSLINHIINTLRIKNISKEVTFSEEFYHENQVRSLKVAATISKLDCLVKRLATEDQQSGGTLSIPLPFEEINGQESEALKGMRQENEALSDLLKEVKQEKEFISRATNETIKNPNEGWVKGLYEKKPDDSTDIAGKFLLGSSDPTNAGKWVNGKKDMGSLLASAFDWAVFEILLLSKFSGVHFNRSSKLLSETLKFEETEVRKYQDSLNAVHKFMAYLLISQAGLESDCQNISTRLLLNDRGLSVRPSMPFRTIDPEDGREIILFQNRDDWTPDEGSQVPLGVDPLGAKWCLERLENHQDILFLLLEPFLSDDNPTLNKAKSLKESGSEEGHCLRIAESLLTDIGAIFSEKYSTVIFKKWAEFANNDTLNPFDKHAKSSEEQEVEELNKIVRFEPLENPLFLNMEGSRLPIILETTRKLIEPIWNNLPNLLERPLPDSKIPVQLSRINGGLDDIKDQFWCLHLNINGERCLFSALAASLLIGAGSKSEINPRVLKQAIVLYLSSGGDKSSRIQALIKAEIGNYGLKTSEQYIEALLNDLINPIQFGTLELELLANALSIHIEVFSSNGSYTIVKGRKTSSTHYGPKNAETRIVLFCKPGNTFYALFPKVKMPLSEFRNAELSLSVRFLEAYWAGNNNIEYSEWNSFTYPNLKTYK